MLSSDSRITGTAAWRIPFLLVALWSLPATAQEAGSEVLITNQMCSGLFMVPLAWDSKDGETHQLLALFDTGATNAFIDPDSLERISGMRLDTGTRAVMQDLTVAGLQFSKFRPRVRELDHLGRALGRDFDVFLPFETFDNFLLTLDYGKKEIRVSRGELPRPDGERIYSSKGSDSRPWIKVEVGSRTRRLLIDSGSNGTISVKSHRSIRFAGEAVPISLSQGMSDLELRYIGRYDGEMQIGPSVFANPIVGITTDTELLGYDVLRHFVLTFDQKNRRVRMAPIGDTPLVMEPRTGSGALMRPRDEGFEVAYVVAGSPAEASGIAVGDLVTRVDGTPVYERGCRDGERPVGPVEYTVLRDNQEIKISSQNSILLH